MVTEIRIYYEGDRKLKEGFRAFLAALYAAAQRLRCPINLIAAGGTPIQDFKDALKTHPLAWNILLKDSEGPDDGNLFPALRVQPSLEDAVFWMVQVMEAWFLADVGGLRRFYGQELHEAALDGNPNVEEIPKHDVYNSLRNATRSTSKGAYHKTHHAPHLLRLIDPERVQQAAPNCRRLFRAVLARLSPP